MDRPSGKKNAVIWRHTVIDTIPAVSVKFFIFVRSTFKICFSYQPDSSFCIQ